MSRLRHTSRPRHLALLSMRLSILRSQLNPLGCDSRGSDSGHVGDMYRGAAMSDRQPQSDAESPLPPPSDPRRAVIVDLLIDLYRQGHCVTTGSMLEHKCETLEVTSPERFQVFRISGEQNR